MRKQLTRRKRIVINRKLLGLTWAILVIQASLSHATAQVSYSVSNVEILRSSFLGADGNDAVTAVATDQMENVFVAGWTTSRLLTSSANGDDHLYGGGSFWGDGYVAKFDPAIGELLFWTFVGGSKDDVVFGITMGRNGLVYVVGETSSEDFPTTPNALSPSYGGGGADAFLTVLEPTEGAIVYSTFLGNQSYPGSGRDQAVSVAVADGETVVVGGLTSSEDFLMTPNAVFPRHSGANDSFITMIDTRNSTVLFSTFLGGTEDDRASDIAITADHVAVLTGRTHSTDFPVTDGALGSKLGGNTDAFVAGFDLQEGTLTFATYLGGSEPDFGHALVTSSDGGVYVVGMTLSDDFPVRSGAFDRTFGGECQACGEGFLTKVDFRGGLGECSTFVGGGKFDAVHDIGIGDDGLLYIVGETDSSDMPTGQDPFVGPKSGGSDAFMVTMEKSCRHQVQGAFHGGTQYDRAMSVAFSSHGAIVAGGTSSADLHMAEAGYDREFGGGSITSHVFADGFLCLVGSPPDKPSQSESSLMEYDVLWAVAALASLALFSAIVIHRKRRATRRRSRAVYNTPLACASHPKPPLSSTDDPSMRQVQTRHV